MNAAWRRITRDAPAVYTLRINGPAPPEVVPDSWDLRAEPEADGPINVLSGEFVDQLSLLGLLKALIDRGCTVLSVECLGHPSRAEKIANFE